MSTNHDDLSKRLNRTTAKLDSLAAQHREFEALSQQFNQDSAKGTIKTPTLETHSYAEITHWYRQQIQSIKPAAKQLDKTAEAVPEPSQTLSQ